MRGEFYKELSDRLSRLQRESPALLVDQHLFGVEKESLRVNAEGLISMADHPRALGSALANRYITTDYAEALLEIVSPPLTSVEDVLGYLRSAHRFIYPRLPAHETIWATSMPCTLPDAGEIRIGEYGTSHQATMKHAYRRGLGLRYGRTMQVIAGVHFNFSWADALWDIWPDIAARPMPAQRSAGGLSARQAYVTDQYFGVTRNLLRYGWLIPFLFGASPAICRSFLGGSDPLPGMLLHNDHTCYEPYGTSLRMGDIGYQYRKGTDVKVRVGYNSLEEYVGDLTREISTPHHRYQQMGLKDADGLPHQLSVNRLQIENEYYSSVRPKPLPVDDELPLLAMARRGINYLELRSVDVNVFDPVGISERQMYFMEVFMLFCLLQPSALFTSNELDVISENMAKVAHRGREPDLQLVRVDKNNERVSRETWGLSLLEQMDAVAALLDQASSSVHYSQALQAQIEKMKDPSQTPSARILAEMLDHHESFFEFACERSRQNHHCLLAADDTDSGEFNDKFFTSETERSLSRQQELEAATSGHFDDWLARQFRQLDGRELESYRVGVGVAG